MSFGKVLIHWPAIALGAINGLIVGGVADKSYSFYYAYRVYHPPHMNVGMLNLWYYVEWWQAPCFFALLFCIVSYAVHVYWARQSRSLVILWQVVGLLSVTVCVPILFIYGWFRFPAYMSEVRLNCVLLLIVAVIVNSLFGALVKLVATYLSRHNSNIV